MWGFDEWQVVMPRKMVVESRVMMSLLLVHPEGYSSTLNEIKWM